MRFFGFKNTINEELDELKGLWKKDWKNWHVYHPDFDYRNPRAQKNTHGVFYMYWNGEHFRIWSPYTTVGEARKILFKNKALLTFNVSMPGGVPGKLEEALVKGDNRETLAEELGFDLDQGGAYSLIDVGDDFYYADFWHSETAENWSDIKKLIKSNWQKNGIKPKNPLPDTLDYLDSSVRDDIIEAVYGAQPTGHGNRHDFNYPQPNQVPDY